MAVPLSYNVRNLFVRRWTSAFTAGGIALAPPAPTLLAARVGGLQQILVTAGEPDNLVVLRKGATSDGSSQVPRDAAQAVRSLSGIAVGADGLPLCSPEIVNQPFMRNPVGGRENGLVRGAGPAHRLRPRSRAGRVPGASPRPAGRGAHVPSEARRGAARRRRRAPLPA